MPEARQRMRRFRVSAKDDFMFLLNADVFGVSGAMECATVFRHKCEWAKKKILDYQSQHQA
jgi:uncharacterized membrane protein YsdA (DUF1294 family)